MPLVGRMRRQISRRPLVVLFLLFLTACGWRNADEFEERLRCGMSTAEVDAIARDLGAESFRPVPDPHAYSTHVVTKGPVFFELFFGPEGLEMVRQGASTGLTTGTSYQPRVNLCTGEITDDVELTIKGAEILAGAEVFVDGELRGRLSSGPSYQLNIAVATGAHEIRVEKESYRPLSVRVNYGQEVEAEELVLPLPESMVPNP